VAGDDMGARRRVARATPSVRGLRGHDAGGGRLNAGGVDDDDVDGGGDDGSGGGGRAERDREGERERSGAGFSRV